MSQLEIEALRSLASMEDSDPPEPFAPFRPNIYTQMQGRNQFSRRPRTVQHYSATPSPGTPKHSQRQQLKKRLRILEEVGCEENTPKMQKRVATSQSLFCMSSAPVPPKSKAFPPTAIRRQPPERWAQMGASSCKQNATPRYCQVNPEELIREEIMRKFKARESVRQSEKMAKISNFLKTAGSQFRQNAVPIFFKKDERLRNTLASLLA